MKKVILIITISLIASFSVIGCSRVIELDSNLNGYHFKKSFFNRSDGVCLISYQDSNDTLLNEEEYSIIDSIMNRIVLRLGTKTRSKLDTSYLRYNIIVKCYYKDEEQIKHLDKRISIINHYIKIKYDSEITEISKEGDFDFFFPSEDKGGYMIITVKLNNIK